MQSADLEVIKDIPGYKVILKAVLKSQIQQLVEQLADHTGEESVILTASVSDGSLSHLGSESGKVFLEDHDDIKSQFLGFCLKRYHKQKQQEKERQQQKSMVTTPPKYGQGPRPRFSHPQTSPRFQTSPRQPIPSPGVHPVSLTRASPQSAGRGLGSGGQRHQPYPAGRLPRASPNFEEGRGPSAVKKPGGPMRLPTDPNKTQKNNPNELIKIEALDEDEKGGDNAEKTTKDNTQAASVSGNTESSDNIADDSVSPSHSESSSHPSSPSRSTQSSVIKREPPEPSPAGDNNDDNLPHGELASDSSNNTGMSGDTIPAGLTKVTTEQASTVSSVSHSVSEQNIIIKTEADEADMDLEITGVEPGQMTPTSDSSWMPGVQNRMGFDPSVSGAGATAGQSEQGFDGHAANHGQERATNQELLNLQERPKKYKCSFCRKGFTRPSHLEMHERIHTGIKPFSCRICGNSFKQKAHLHTHMLTHTMI